MERGTNMRVIIRNASKSNSIACILRPDSPDTTLEVEKGNVMLEPGYIIVLRLTANAEIDNLKLSGELTSQNSNMKAYFELWYGYNTVFSVSGKKNDSLYASFSIEELPEKSGFKEFRLSFADIR